MSDNSNVMPEQQDNIAGNANAGESMADNSVNETVIESGVFKGKTMAEAGNMHIQDQAMVSKQGAIIGEMRKDIEHLKQVTTVPLKTDEEIADLMTTDPVNAVKEMKRKISEEMQASNRLTPGQKYLQENPVLSTPEYEKWANESGMSGMAKMAVDNLNSSGDATAVNSLLNAYQKATNQATKQNNINSAQQASSPGSTGITPKSKFKFTQVQIDKMSDSERESKDAEILQAYQDKLVG